MSRKIVFYTHAHSAGGAELTFDRLARAFAAEGDEVVFVADYGGDHKAVDTRNLRHVVLGPNHARSTLRLASLLRRERPDASFSALGAQNLKHAIAATIAGRRHRCVLGYHGFACVEPKRLSRLSYWLSPVTTRLAARTICVSDALLADIAGRWRGDRAKMVRIYNPVPQIGDTGGAATRDPNLVLALGRLVPFKRFPDLVAAFALVTSEARLVILGEGPERPTIERKIAELGLADRVELPGHVDDTSPWYLRAACVAISSESESFGLTSAEALAHGVPVVTTACSGPPEVLGGEACGTVVPIGDITAFGTALSATLAKPADPAPCLARAATFSLVTIRDAYAALADSLG